MDEKKTDKKEATPSLDSHDQPTLIEEPAVPPKDDQGTEAISRTTSVPFEPHYLEGFSLLLVLGSITIATFLVLLDSSIIATAIPQITSEFHSLKDIGWYGSAFQITSAVLQPLVGKIYTQFSLKWTFISFFALFEVGSLICGVASSSKVLIVGRAVAGMGVSGVFSGALTILSAAMPPSKRTILTGIMVGVAQLGVVIGPLLGGVFTEDVSWRWCFYINLPLGGLVLLGLAFIPIANQQPLPPFREALKNIPTRLDLVGFVLFAGAAIQLLLALQWGGNTYAWNSAKIIGLFCGSGGVLVLYLLWSRHKGDDALIPAKLFKHRVIIACSFLTLFMFGSTFCVVYWMPIYFQTVRGASPIVSGVHLLPNILTTVTFGIVGGVLMSKVGYYLPQTVAGCAIITIGTGLLSTLSPHSSVAHWAGFQVLVGVGRGFMQQTSFTAIPHASPPKMIPQAMSFMVFGQYIGGSIFLSLTNVVFDARLGPSLAKYAPHANATAIIAAGASSSYVRSSVSASDLPGVLKAYSVSVDAVLYLATGVAGALFVTSFFVGWVDVRVKKEEPKKDDPEAAPSGESVTPEAISSSSAVEEETKETKETRA